MSDTTQTNAMAEIALALAMGFFSIMVLTMVSMGGGLVASTAESAIDQNPISVAQNSENTQSTPQQGSASAKVEPQDLVIYYANTFWDHALQPVNPKSLLDHEKLVLAVSPDLSMSQTMAAREKLSHPDITVVVLNDKWIKAIKEAGL